MTYKNSNPATVFYIKERKKAKFLKDELFIIMLMLSVMLWFVFCFFGFQLLFFSITIQTTLLIIGFKMISTEKNRYDEATSMLSKIESDNIEQAKIYREWSEKTFEKYKRESNYREKPNNKIGFILNELENPNINRSTKIELIELLNYYLMEYYV